MITGNSRRPVTRYRLIDHCADGGGFVEPDSAVGERFAGVPYGGQCYASLPFIEVLDRAGKVLRTVNAIDCAEIEFADTEEPSPSGAK